MDINELDLGSNKKCAEVSHVKSPKNFWVRLEELKDDYNDMMRQMQREYSNEDSCLIPRYLALGSVYCVFNQKLFEWQRCEVLKVNRTDAAIIYIDIGVTDLVPVKSIRVLKENYKTISRCAIHCSLDNLRPSEGNVWGSTAIKNLSEKILNKVVTLNFKSKTDNVYNVEMFVKNQNMSDYLIREGMAVFDCEPMPVKVPIGSPTHNELHTSRFIKPPAIQLGPTQHEIEVTCIYSPFCFYAQILEDKEDFLDFEDRLQAFYHNTLKQSDVVVLKRPKVGQMCVAKYSADEAWYRALIKEKNAELNTVQVFFIDYGNDDTIPIDGNLCVIDEQFVAYPCMGVMCCLEGVRPLAEQSASLARVDEIINFMFDAMATKVYASFVAKHEQCYKVNLKLEEKNEFGKVVVHDMAELLLERNFVLKADEKKAGEVRAAPKKSRLPKVNHSEVTHQAKFKAFVRNEPLIDKNKTLEFTVSHVETLCEFYVQINVPRDLDYLRPLMTDLQYFYEKK